MKKNSILGSRTSLILILVCNLPWFSFSQNVWDASSTSTFTTNGQAAIGQASAQTGYRFTVSSTNNTVYNGFYNNIVNTYNGTQIGFYNNMNNSAGTGNKYGIFNIVNNNTTGQKYGIYSAVAGTGGGDKYAGYFAVNSGAGKNYGVYSSVTGTASRSGYFTGGNLEVVGSGIVLTGSNTTSKFLLHSPWQAGEAFLTLAPNATDSQEDWNFAAGMTLFRNGSMKKTIPTLSSTLKAFYIGDFNGQDIFRIYGDGKVYATEINVRIATNFPDYVFKPDYKLLPLHELKKYIYLNGHLPNIPSASEVNESGINVSEMNIKMMEKIEELTLYIIKQQEEIDALKEQIVK